MICRLLIFDIKIVNLVTNVNVNACFNTCLLNKVPYVKKKKKIVSFPILRCTFKFYCTIERENFKS